jgi:hypothetical protein
MTEEKDKTMREEDLILEEEVTVQEPSGAVKEENPAGTKLNVSAGEQDAVAPKIEEKKESPVKIAYTVGMKEDGKFIFNISGSGPGLLELLGLHTLASKKIGIMYDKAQMEGEATIHAQFQLLHQKFNKTLETLNALFTSLAMEKKDAETPIKPTPGSNIIKK